jgi:prepilin-type N-terminal cleavage/methylation domain-containing protein/prepilin-type processing-associated H-X9-DG protein
MIARPSSRAFTLIEILVVVAVIALVAGVIVPMIQRAGARAHQASCSGNMRQIWMSLREYIALNSYHLPRCTRRPSQPPAGEEGMPGFAETLKPYLGNPKVMKCPTDPGTYYGSDGTSYEWNSLLNGKAIGQENLSIVGITIEVPLLVDYETFHIGASEPGKNFLYADGSVVREFKQ